MGIKAEMQAKLKPMAAEDTVEVVARGEADMVVVVSTRISDVAGVDGSGQFLMNCRRKSALPQV